MQQLTEGKEKAMEKTGGLIKRILSGSITVILLLLLATAMVQKISGNPPGFFGYHMMNVLTGSMEPEIMTGDAILVRECGADEVKLGDVVCYRGTSGVMTGRMITHKVVAAPYECDGEIWLQTQGTANLVPDDPIKGEQVYGKVVCRLLLIGKIYSFFCTVPGLIIVTVPILWMIFDGIKDIIGGVDGEDEESDEEGSNSKG